MVGLTQFGASVVTLTPGAWSSQRHWHERDDEDHGEYSDIDMAFAKGRYSGGKRGIFRHKDGTPY